MSAGAIPLTQPQATISEEMIRALVQAFYERVLRDEALGPVFRDRLDQRWDEHLAVMVDFWSSVALSTGRYAGKPHLAHRDLGLDPEHFGRWLDLFETTARETCGEAAPFFVDRAHRIADSLMIGLGIGPKALVRPGLAEARL
ncbi:group III truncated hemoglobin [Salinarimonas soli]|uniref:Group III truncated hemoglobin n=1 Tax=Salinarimonas soli TaxID=1638099 RepID=A0A5B2VE85_9HYPH|nr:group III truncated hemoglobin [Salinarimonas soli]KAA2236477.1 group III truncated hemoglobin [Salinarimonas soli]